MNQTGPDISRRALLTGISATAAAAWLPAQASAAPRRWIDVHHHFACQALRDFYATARNADGSAAVMPPMHWNLDADLEDMERGGTATAVLSQFVPADVGTLESRRVLARGINEAAAKLAGDHRGRFGHFAALPLPDVDGCLTEIAYALDVLKADGFSTYTSLGDRWQGNAAFDAVYAELNRRKAVVFVHPTSPNCCRALVPGVPDPVIEFGTDTTRAIAGLVFGGVTTRFPDIRFIFSHAGGTMPFLIERFLGGTQAELVPGFATHGQDPPWTPTQPPQGALHELRKLYYDTAQASNPVAMGALKRLVPISQILYGTDVYYRTSVYTADALTHCGVYSRRELQALGRDNALALLPQLHG
jgi:predicted TIM-barrel fold metal-dependent hydrolase